MAGKLIASTGHAKHIHGIGSVIKAYRGGRIDVYGGASAPATADVAATGTKLYSITNRGLSSAAKQKVRITPTVGTDAVANWIIIVNGIALTFTSDSNPTATEVCTGLEALLVAANTGTLTTPAGSINIPDVYGKMTITNNTTTLDIESSTAGVPIDITSSTTSVGGTFISEVTVEDAYGLEFENPSDITSGILEKLASQEWSGIGVAEGIPTYFRLVQMSDAGTSSTSLPRLQGAVSTIVGSAMVVSNATVKVGQRVFVDSAAFNIPLT